MSAKQFSYDFDLLKVGQLLNFRVHNLISSDRVTLGGSLNANHIGLTVWDTDLSKLFVWDGDWIDMGSSVSNVMTYNGAHSSLTTAPAAPVQGSAYVMTAAGTLTWAGQTFSPSAVVAVGDMVVYRGSSTWDIYEANVQAASETIAGLIEIATQVEVNAGTDDVRAVTPAKLTSFVNTKAFAKTYYNNAVNLTANTPETITHNLGLQNKDSFTISIKDSSGSEIGVDVDSVNTNSLTLTSFVAQTGVKVTVIGF